MTGSHTLPGIVRNTDDREAIREDTGRFRPDTKRVIEAPKRGRGGSNDIYQYTTVPFSAPPPSDE